MVHDLAVDEQRSIELDWMRMNTSVDTAQKRNTWIFSWIEQKKQKGALCKNQGFLDDGPLLQVLAKCLYVPRLLYTAV